MAKFLPGRSAGPDDPIYTGGARIFTPQRPAPSSTASPPHTEEEPSTPEDVDDGDLSEEVSLMDYLDGVIAQMPSKP